MKINNPENIWNFFTLYFIVTDIPDHCLCARQYIPKNRVTEIIHSNVTFTANVKSSFW